MQAATSTSRRAQIWMIDPLPLRACDLCDHGVDIEGTRYCRSAEVATANRPRLVDQARAPTGACGPEARHMAAAFLGTH